LNQF